MNGTDILDSTPAVRTLDELLEVFLESLLRIEHIKNVGVFLFNGRGDLIQVAEGTNETEGVVAKSKIMVQSWLMESQVRHSRRRVGLPKLATVISIPLAESGQILGYVRIEFRRFTVPSTDDLHKYYRAGLQLAAKIRMITLEKELEDSRKEHQSLLANNAELLHRITSLSKELYAITAISTKINQSMEFEKSLRKSIAKLKDLFKAAGVAIYVRDTETGCVQVAATCREGEDREIDSVPWIEDRIVLDIVSADRPITLKCREASSFAERLHSNIEGSTYPVIIGVPLTSREANIGALIIGRNSDKDYTQDSLRLLSGIANIMGIAIENMGLYRQSERNNRDAGFLAKSIAEFNRTLNLKETLGSVVRKTAEFAGPGCQVFLFSETRIPLMHGTHLGGDGESGIQTSAINRVRPPAMNKIVRSILSHAGYGSILFQKVGDSEEAPSDVRAYLRELRIGSVIAMPLQIRGKRVGLLLVGRGRGQTTFDTHDLSVVEALGSAASVAIDIARTYAWTLDLSDSKDFEITEKDDRIHLIHERQQSRIEARDEIIFWVNNVNRYVFGNKAMEIVTGYTKEELCLGSTTIEEGVDNEDVGRMLECLEKIRSRELKVVKDLDCRHVNRSGEEHFISISLYPLMDLSGQIIGVEGVGRDITEERRLEAELEKAKDLAILGEFSGAVAHQIRNPLGNILMGTKLLQKALSLDGALRGNEKMVDGEGAFSRVDREALEDIFCNLSDGVNNLNAVVTELLAYTSTMKLSLSSQDINLLIMESVHALEDMIKKNAIRVEYNFDSSLPPFQLDAVLMANVFQNIVHNAIQAMPSGGRLRLTTAVSAQRPGHSILSVSDTGLGIPRSEIDKIFRPFYTTKDDGVGLGLSLAHRIVEAHKGMMWACNNPCPHLATLDSERAECSQPPSRGVTVHIMLPLS